jgi:hypothetical protein
MVGNEAVDEAYFMITMAGTRTAWHLCVLVTALPLATTVVDLSCSGTACASGEIALLPYGKHADFIPHSLDSLTCQRSELTEGVGKVYRCNQIVRSFCYADLRLLADFRSPPSFVLTQLHLSLLSEHNLPA